MRLPRLIIAVWILLACTGLSFADNKTKDSKKTDSEFKDKIVGTWIVVEDNAYKKGTEVTFSKDGKFSFRPKGEKKSATGTYELDGNKFTVTTSNLTSPPWTIESITDKEMQLKDVGGGKAVWSKK